MRRRMFLLVTGATVASCLPSFTAPGEVRTRTAVRSLVADLMSSPRQATMPGLPAFASRVHVTV